MAKTVKARRRNAHDGLAMELKTVGLSDSIVVVVIGKSIQKTQNPMNNFTKQRERERRSSDNYEQKTTKMELFDCWRERRRRRENCMCA